MSVTRRDWWVGVALVIAAILVHAAWPRYEWRTVAGRVFVRLDRWTGGAEIGRFDEARRWTTGAEPLSIIKVEPLPPQEPQR